MKKLIKKIDWLLSRLEDAVVLLTLGAMLIILFAQVIMRYVFNSPLEWSEETARYLFVYLSFIGISYGIRMNTHIRMEVLVNLLPKAARKVLAILIDLSTAGLYVYLISNCSPFLKTQEYVHSTTLGITMDVVYYALPIGIAMAALRLLMKSYMTIAEFRSEEAV